MKYAWYTFREWSSYSKHVVPRTTQHACPANEYITHLFFLILNLFAWEHLIIIKESSAVSLRVNEMDHHGTWNVTGRNIFSWKRFHQVSQQTRRAACTGFFLATVLESRNIKGFCFYFSSYPDKRSKQLATCVKRTNCLIEFTTKILIAINVVLIGNPVTSMTYVFCATRY